jgi:hypothetical protein
MGTEAVRMPWMELAELKDRQTELAAEIKAIKDLLATGLLGINERFTAVLDRLETMEAEVRRLERHLKDRPSFNVMSI